MSNLQRIVYLSNTEYATLLSEGTITKNGRTLTYNANDLYITPENTDENTTYTFTDGTNSFTVTSSDGDIQTVNITPSIANNITGSGTNNYIAKFSGTNTLTAGPQLGSSTTTFLNNSGTWTTPTDTTYVFDGTYNASTNKAATVSTVTSAIANATITEAQVTNLTTDLSSKAPLNSPVFTGIPQAPTAAITNHTNQLATTAFVASRAPEFIVSTNSTSSSNLVGTSIDTTLWDGKIIYYFTIYTLPATAASITLNLSNGTTTDTIPIYVYDTVRSTTPYPANTIITLVYYNNAFYIASSPFGVVA